MKPDLDEDYALERVIHYLQCGVPIWLKSADLVHAATVLRCHGGLRTEAGMRSAGWVLERARSSLREHRESAKGLFAKVSWDAPSAWDAAWNASRIAGWEPVRRIEKQLPREAPSFLRGILLSAGHAARGAAWKIAWRAIADDAEERRHGEVAWDALKEIATAVDDELRRFDP